MQQDLQLCIRVLMRVEAGAAPCSFLMEEFYDLLTVRVCVA